MKKVFITGTSSGIGQAFKEHLLANDYDVTSPSRVELDLSNFNINDINLGSYDYLILCAGVDTNGRQPFVKQKEADFVNTLTVNLLANMRLVHKYVQQRYYKQWSKVIVIGSTIVDTISPNFVAYSTSKVALATFVNILRKELARTSIGVSLIHPGPTETNFHVNKDNGPVVDKEILYNLPYITTEDLIPAFDQALNDKQHLLKTVSISK